MPYYRDESNGEDSKSKKSVTLPDEFAEFLTVEADRQGITPDDLLDDIIREEVLFRHPLSKVGYVEIPNPEFQSYLDRLTINDIKEVAREQASRNFDSVLSLLRGKPGDFNSMIEQFYKIFSKYSGWFT
ncbi:MAG: hypothetical protein ACRDFB_06720, partial [Rhabdochlamydiaceae bacterium]